MSEWIARAAATLAGAAERVLPSARKRPTRTAPGGREPRQVAATRDAVDRLRLRPLTWIACGLLTLLAGCAPDRDNEAPGTTPATTTLHTESVAEIETDPSSMTKASYQQSLTDLVAGQIMAVAYSGFREGQHPDRGDGAVNPSDAEILEDLRILDAHGLHLIRVYDAGENSATTLRLIREHGLPIKVLLGMWLNAEVSNHEGCAWLDEPIPAATLAANKLVNAAEVQRGIELAQAFDDIVIAVNVGNEALVDWNDHMVTRDSVIAYVREVKAAIAQPVTVADNYVWWINEGAPLAAEVDFIGVHTYPQWEEKSIDEALAYTIENVEDVHAALPAKPIVVLEGGWATIASEFGERANEADQARYYREVEQWARETNTTFFFFEAFDEPWKGNPADPLGAEKHWGLFNVDRSPKLLMRTRNNPVASPLAR